MTILLFNYYWPPSGGPAVQRWLDITNRLEDLGVKTIVVTIDPDKATFPFIDTTLNKRIHPSTVTYRTGTSELFSVYKKYIGKGKVPGHGMAAQSDEGWKQKIARFIRGNFLLPDPRKGWNKHAIKQGKEILAHEKIDIIFTAGPPHSTHLIGKKLKKLYPAIPWVADFHDYWTEISYLSKLFYRTKLAASIDRAIEISVLRDADYVMTHCQSSVEIQQQKSGKSSEQFILYRMGYNEHLYARQSPVRQDRFVIAYIGMIAGFYNPDKFFKALKNRIDKHPDIPVLLQFVGSIDPEIREMLASTGLKNNVEEVGYVAHEKSIEYMYESTALLLVNPEFQHNRFHVPGKLYEYLAAYKPIIAISANGSENEQIITKEKAGKNFSHDEYNNMVSYIDELMTEWKTKRNLDWDYNSDIEKYGRNHQTDLLVGRVKKIISKS